MKNTLFAFFCLLVLFTGGKADAVTCAAGVVGYIPFDFCGPNLYSPCNVHLNELYDHPTIRFRATPHQAGSTDFWTAYWASWQFARWAHPLRRGYVKDTEVIDCW